MKIEIEISADALARIVGQMPEKLQQLLEEPEPVSDFNKSEQVDTLSLDMEIANLAKEQWVAERKDKLVTFTSLIDRLEKYFLNGVVVVPDGGTHRVIGAAPKNGHGWASKTALIAAYPKSKATAQRHFNDVESYFETTKVGSNVYVRLRKEQPPLRGRFIEQVEQVDTLSTYRQRLSDEAKESIAKKKAEGKVFTGEVFGWDRQGDDMVPNWREQDIIDYMRFRHYEQNWSGNKIAKHFNTLELKGKKGGAWTSSMVLRTCRYEFHANRRKFNPPIWWGREAYHDAVEYNSPIPELKEEV